MKQLLYRRGRTVAEDQERREEAMRSPGHDFHALVWYYQKNGDPKPLEDMLRTRELHGKNRRFAQRALCSMD
jgi:hypothetical protein